MDDAHKAELLDLCRLCEDVPLFSDIFKKVSDAHPSGREKLRFYEALRRMLDFLASDFVFYTRLRLQQSGVSSVEDVRRAARSEEHTSELQSQSNLVCRLLLEK